MQGREAIELKRAFGPSNKAYPTKLMHKLLDYRDAGHFTTKQVDGNLTLFTAVVSNQALENVSCYPRIKSRSF